MRHSARHTEGLCWHVSEHRSSESMRPHPLPGDDSRHRHWKLATRCAWSAVLLAALTAGFSACGSTATAGADGPDPGTSANTSSTPSASPSPASPQSFEVDPAIKTALPTSFLDLIAQNCAELASRRESGADLYYSTEPATVTPNGNYDPSRYSSSLMWSGQYVVVVPLEVVHADGTQQPLSEACFADSDGKTEVDVSKMLN